MQLRQSEQLFVCCGEAKKKNAPLSKQRLSRWVVEVIALAYKKAGQPVPGTITCHSSRAVSSSCSAFRGVSLTDVCVLSFVHLRGSTMPMLLLLNI